MLTLFSIIILSYLVGSIPTGLIIGKAVKGIDIRNFGSSSTGGTNVSRLLGWKFGLLVIILDAIKGAIAVIFIARLYYLGSMPFENPTPFDDFTFVQIIAGMSAVIGHIWTIFAQFRGGKGIATVLGFLVSLITIEALFAFGIFLLVVTISRYVSLGSIIAAISVPIILVIRATVFHIEIPGYNIILPFVIFVAVLVIYTHRKNIDRLFSGKEKRFSFKKKIKIT
ncbi:MAG: glycerol-3-phosphate 1-O-acyltransferase PlsY [Ignavibacteriales bacterium]|nr:glycerol-3-phosphate 1-O-acyltransferase PlsY [Ignavibacteriales bacterium]